MVHVLDTPANLLTVRIGTPFHRDDFLMGTLHPDRGEGTLQTAVIRDVGLLTEIITFDDVVSIRADRDGTWRFDRLLRPSAMEAFVATVRGPNDATEVIHRLHHFSQLQLAGKIVRHDERTIIALAIQRHSAGRLIHQLDEMQADGLLQQWTPTVTRFSDRVKHATL